MADGASQDPYPHLAFRPGVDWVHEDPAFLRRLDTAGGRLGVVLDVFSGARSRAYNEQVGGAPNSLHIPDAQGLAHAVDANAGMVPVGDAPGAVGILHSLGLRTGAVDFTYEGKPDPAHVDTGLGTRPMSTSSGTDTATVQQPPGGAPFPPADQFVIAVSKLTGLDPRVVYAWVKTEGAYASGGTGGYNYLNLRPYPGDHYVSVSAGGFEQFSNVGDAVQATVRRINQPFARPIRQAKSGTAGELIHAIGTSGWGTNEATLQRTFDSLFTPAAEQTRKPWGTPEQLVSGFEAGSASDWTSGGTGIPNAIVGAGKDAVDSATSVAHFLGKLSDPKFWVRVLEIGGGAALVLIGLAIIARNLGAPMPGLPGPLGKMAGAGGLPEWRRAQGPAVRDPNIGKPTPVYKTRGSGPGPADEIPF